MPDEPSKKNVKGMGVNDPSLQAIENNLHDIEVTDNGADNFPSSPAIKPKKSKKKLAIFIIIVLLVLGIGGGAAAYMVYSNPEKVVFDAVQNSIKAKTNITDGNFKLVDSENNGNVSVDFTSQSNSPKLAGSLEAKVKIDYKDFKINLAGAGMVSEQGDYYFKVDNASELLDKALESEYGKLYVSEPSLQPLVTKVKAFVKKIDGRWIKVEKSDISEFSKDYDKQQACVEKAVKKFYDDNKQQQQIIDTYGDHRFIIVKTSNKPSQTINGEDSVAYDLKLDVKKGNEFGEAVGKTDVFKALEKCSDATRTSTNKMSDKEVKEAQKEADKVKVTVWVSRWGHNLTRIEVSGNENSTQINFGANVDQNKTPNLKDPSNPLKAKDLTKELEAIYREANTLGGGETEELSTASMQEF